jgi:soluble lytic murein transglycosylase
MIRFFLFFLPIVIFGDIVTLDFINKAPSSISKDFYIWRFLNQRGVTSKEANLVYKQRYIKSNKKILYAYAKSTDDKNIKDMVRCMKLRYKNINSTLSVKCLKYAITTYKATKINRNIRHKIANKIYKKNETVAKMLRILNKSYPFGSLMLTDKDTFFLLFNGSGQKYRRAFLNRRLSHKLIGKIAEDRRFDKTLKLILIDKNLDELRASLLGIDGKKLSHRANFYLALNALKYNKKIDAHTYLDYAFKKASVRIDRDKVMFWKYLVSGYNAYLLKLLKSTDKNMYTIYASEVLGIKEKRFISSVESPYKNYKSPFDPEDPFDWERVRKSIPKKITQKRLLDYYKLFNTKNLEAHLAYVLGKANYKKHYFILGNYEYLKGYSIKRQNMILALARQESRFIPTSISTSYAMGTMQIMPFLSKQLASQKREIYNIDDMLLAEKNYDYANTHLDFLETRLIHPLFIAYAYNGGYGFVKRQIQKGLFSKGEYEPFMSMELISYNESRKYGKKVLANYVVYSKILDKSVSITNLFEKLIPTAQILYENMSN